MAFSLAVAANGSHRRRSDKALHSHSPQPMEWDTKVLQYRLNELRRQTLEEEFALSNVSDNPIAFVETCLRRLQCNDDPRPDSGIRYLLRMSTKSWRQKILQSVGAPWSSLDSHPEVVVAAVSAAMAQPDNQYALLLLSASEEEEGEGGAYRAVFPSEPLVFQDDDDALGRTAWVECQLRHPVTDALLVAMGWQLREEEDASWRMERIDWQDFREPFRPGVGREEWMRICG
jgi:hypothetical protein